MQSTPDTTPGVHPSQSVSVAGTVSELKVDGDWSYNLQYQLDPSFSFIIFNLALCQATLFKYSVAWQRVKEVKNRLNLLFFFFISHFFRLLFSFLLAFINFFLIFF